MAHSPLKLAVLISGGGRTLMNLQEKIEAGSLDGRIEVVVSSRPEVKGVERSKALGLPTRIIPRRDLSADAFQNAVTEAVAGMDLVCMAGFLSLWRIPEEMIGCVVNIHPALLPAFGGHGMYGRRVHEAVLSAGSHESGCTVHFCDNQYDHGPIILQRKIAVRPDDTPDSLAQRVFAEECVAYPEAIRRIISKEARYEP